MPPTVRLIGRGWSLGLALALGTLCLSACSAPEAEPAGEEETVAVVNGEAIREGELQEALLQEAGARVLGEMIDEAIISRAAQRAGLAAAPAQVEMRLQSALALAGGEAGYEAMLREQGLDEERFRRRAELAVLLDALALREIRPTRQEIEQYYEEQRERFAHGPKARGRLILCSTKENAETLWQALEAGGDFAGLARELSEDPATREQGGDMGWFEAEDYAPEITRVAFALEPGQFSEVIEGPDGFYLVRVEERKPAGEQPLAEVREEIETILRYQRLPEERARWLQGRRQRVRLGVEEAGLREAVERHLEHAPPPSVGAF